ncbi:cytochrome c-type biogenesis protein CcsB [Robiginitalea myxolifaciens]|uniref:Cytochrome c-type biogenesis protein CcsB n=1 Tax=Robiginitalea myxolifaciens TaxID=400055 RepID=A0A1I6H0T3_9FLAO|nr:cytochrome c biogenesis protein CcsA [Robiginitalea myxolifaciens]SFR48086.1 cytochrome c-type biogenesis protein CcsB [Robiginitalea myxolifaciens]
MLKAFEKFLFSTRFMAVLFLGLAVAMAFGTFIESWYSTETARVWIYNTWWFEGIMVLFVVNFFGNIQRYRLLQWKKWPVLLLHLSWILIIVGAAITRYISFEGMMPIREGATERVFYSDKTYLTLLVDGEMNGQTMRKPLQEEIIVTEEALKSGLPWNTDFDGTPVRVDYAGFVKGAELGIVPDPAGDQYLKVVESGGGTRHEHYLKEGEIANIHNILFTYNNRQAGAVNIIINDSIQSIESPFAGSFMRMADQFSGVVAADSIQQLQMRSLYTLGSQQFVLPDPPVRGRYDVVAIPENERTDNDLDALLVDVTIGSETQQLKLLGSKGRAEYNEPSTIGGLQVRGSYGSKVYELPFSITLNDFIAEKYPGTEQGYASFMSKITVRDSLGGERPFDYDIYMNHVLDHKGYRFFQASFSPDEKGTVLSVNHDWWGTWITYIGYFLLYIGLMGIMFFGKTRFKDLGAQLEKLKKKKARQAAAGLFFLGMLLGVTQVQAQQTQGTDPQAAIPVNSPPVSNSQTEAAALNPAVEQDHLHRQLPPKELIDSLILATAIPLEQAEAFGHLVIQDDGGRMKPVNTFSSELLRKISFKSTYNGLSSDQVLLSMLMQPNLWTVAEFIALDKKTQNDSIRSMIGVPKDREYVRLIEFFDENAQNKLDPVLREAFATNTPDKFQQDFKDAYFRLGLLNRALSGEILKIFPLIDDSNNKWISAPDYATGDYVVRDTLYSNFIRNSMNFYLMTLQQAQQTGDYSEADKLLAAFRQNQLNHGSAVRPSDNRIETEVVYNKLDIFNRLYKYYALSGLLLFFVLVFQIFRERRIWDIGNFFFKGVIWLLFFWHTIGLVLRWYISGHAPWSDAYESILYVSWATMAMGLALGRKSDMTIAASAFVTSMLLWIAHQSWVDPAIANLQPVLDSYWLMIHVAVIVGSYGPLTVGMILGVVSLILILLTTKKNRERMKLNLRELTVINELSLTVGLVMLTIGNFLGGQWANESWGRYWGWDPKETWALISIMVYAFVIHTRLIPGLRGNWTFNFLSILAFSSIMMTYFGVNFYLAGLHSYASGAQVITPSFVWYTLLGVLILGVLSRWRYQVHYHKK